MVKHTRRRVRRGVRFAAVGALVAGGLMVSQSVSNGAVQGAGDAPGVLRDGGAGLGGRLETALGASRTAGSWLAADGRTVVAVTDEKAAAEVTRAGARPKQVRYSMEQLDSAARTLRAGPRVAGTAWMVDPTSNEVVVLGDSTVSTDRWSRMKGVAARVGGEVRMERTTGAFTLRTSGAAPIFASGSRCSAGFNVTDGQNGYILTAGHCGPNGTTWFTDTSGRTGIGTTVQSNFPGNDFSLIRYDNSAVDRRGIVDIGGGRTVRITGVADPVVGQEVFRSGSTTGLRSGKVTGLNATVNYPEGTVSGLIRTTVCAEPGDSGGPLLAQGVALGVTSGGSGDCDKGGVTFFQPVTKALTALGVTIPGTKTGGAKAGGAPTGPAGGAITPEGTGAEDRSLSVDGVLNRFRDLDPGVLIIGAGLVGLLSTLTIRPGGRKRRYPDHYSTGWG